MDIKVQEFYKLSDIVLANLTTSSGDEMLETGGMIYIEASSNGDPCKLAKDSYVEIAFPTAEIKPDMQLFMGEWTNGEVNWVADNTANQNQIFGYNSVDQKPAFPGGEIKINEFLGNNITYPQAALNKGINGNVGVRFLVGKDGGIRDIRILKKLDPACDDEVLKALEKIPKFIPGKLNGQVVNVEMDMNIMFRFERYTKGNNWVVGLQPGPETSNNGQSPNRLKESAYLLQSNKLGWINCDRFIKKGANLTSCSVLHEKHQNLDVKIFFEAYRSLLGGGTGSSAGTVFKNIPIGQNITVLAIKVEDDKIFMSMEDTVVTKNGEYELEFSEVTQEQLKAELERLKIRE